MKIKNLFVGMLAGAAMVACTNEEFESGVNNGAIQAGDQAFVAVNIFAPGVTRAFDPGTEAESAVRDAIFLFLDGNYKGCAEPCYVTSDKLSWSTDGVADHQTKKGTTLVINGIEDEVPAYIVAILNPINKNAYNAKTSLKQLKAEYANYASAENGGYFVMSNAVYAADNKEEVVATPIALENIAHTREELQNDSYKPVSIQVERTVGKVAVNNLDAAISTLNTTGLTETIDDSESMKLKFVLTGWEVLQNKATNLIKNIDASEWTIKNLANLDDASFYKWNWNDLGRRRSYWANDNKSKDRYAYKVEAMSNAASKYVEETVNQVATAADALDNDSPYLLVSGKFVDAKTNAAVDLVEWRGQKYTEKGYLNLIAGMESVSQYYYIDGKDADGNNVYKSFKADFLEMVDNNSNDWGATAMLKSDAPQFYTVTFEDDGKTIVNEATTAAIADVKAAIAEFGEVQYWNGGNTYYFVPIKHQANDAETNFYGVVRNHCYQMNISKINGYGTPVANPGQAIDQPEKPTEDDSYMNAEVVILNWNVIANDNVEL